MSIATESLHPQLSYHLRLVESDCRQMARDQEAKVRRNPRGGIDIKFKGGEKKHFDGWKQMQRELGVMFDLFD